MGQTFTLLRTTEIKVVLPRPQKSTTERHPAEVEYRTTLRNLPFKTLRINLTLSVPCIILQCVNKPTRCNTSYEWSLFFIIWLYMFRTITSPSSGASSHKPYNALVCSCYQACLAVAWIYVVGSKSFRPDQLLKVTEIKQICHFLT